MINLLDRVKKVKSRNFMEAVAAAGAMVAFADGLVRPEEVDKLLEYVRMDENLRVFDSLEVIETFDKYIQQFAFDFQIGREMAVKSIRKIDRNTEAPRLLILVCIAIAGADGDFDNNQRLVVRDICRILGIDHRQFDLNLRAPSPKDFPKGKECRPRKAVPNNVPEWMKNPPRLHVPPKKEDRMPDWMRNPPKIQKQTEKKDNIPDWMRNPPRLPEPSAQKEQLPEWMRNPPKMRKQTEKTENIPEWMKNPSKVQKPHDHKADLPEWMRNPPTLEENTKKQENMPDWMKKMETVNSKGQ